MQLSWPQLSKVRVRGQERSVQHLHCFLAIINYSLSIIVLTMLVVVRLFLFVCLFVLMPLPQTSTSVRKRVEYKFEESVSRRRINTRKTSVLQIALALFQ